MNQKLFFRLFLILSLAIFAVAGCATTKNAGVATKEGATAAGKQVGETAEDIGGKIQDASITSAIKMKLANDESVSASDINVDTVNGHVTLTGKVKSKESLDRAIQLGRSVDGVKTVQSNLTIPSRRK